MRRLPCLVLTLLLFAAPLTAHADEPSKRAKIDEMFSLLRIDALMQQMTAAAQAQAKATMQTMAPGTDAATQAKAEEFMGKMFDLITEELSWKTLEPEMAQLYSDNFTEAQIDDILTFYKTPTGKALLDKLPQLSTAGMQIAQRRMVDLEPKMKALVDQMTQEITSPPPAAKRTPAPKSKGKS